MICIALSRDMPHDARLFNVRSFPNLQAARVRHIRYIYFTNCICQREDALNCALRTSILILRLIGSSSERQFPVLLRNSNIKAHLSRSDIPAAISMPRVKEQFTFTQRNTHVFLVHRRFFSKSIANRISRTLKGKRDLHKT